MEEQNIPGRFSKYSERAAAAILPQTGRRRTVASQPDETISDALHSGGNFASRGFACAAAPLASYQLHQGEAVDILTGTMPIAGMPNAEVQKGCLFWSGCANALNTYCSNAQGSVAGWRGMTGRFSARPPPGYLENRKGDDEGDVGTSIEGMQRGKRKVQATFCRVLRAAVGGNTPGSQGLGGGGMQPPVRAEW